MRAAPGNEAAGPRFGQRLLDVICDGPIYPEKKIEALAKAIDGDRDLLVDRIADLEMRLETAKEAARTWSLQLAEARGELAIQATQAEVDLDHQEAEMERVHAAEIQEALIRGAHQQSLGLRFLIEEAVARHAWTIAPERIRNTGPFPPVVYLDSVRAALDEILGEPSTAVPQWRTPAEEMPRRGAPIEFETTDDQVWRGVAQDSAVAGWVDWHAAGQGLYSTSGIRRWRPDVGGDSLDRELAAQDLVNPRLDAPAWTGADIAKAEVTEPRLDRVPRGTTKVVHPQVAETQGRSDPSGRVGGTDPKSSPPVCPGSGAAIPRGGHYFCDRCGMEGFASRGYVPDHVAGAGVLDKRPEIEVRLDAWQLDYLRGHLGMPPSATALEVRERVVAELREPRRAPVIARDADGRRILDLGDGSTPIAEALHEGDCDCSDCVEERNDAGLALREEDCGAAHLLTDLETFVCPSCTTEVAADLTGDPAHCPRCGEAMTLLSRFDPDQADFPADEDPGFEAALHRLVSRLDERLAVRLSTALAPHTLPGRAEAVRTAVLAEIARWWGPEAVRAAPEGPSGGDDFDPEPDDPATGEMDLATLGECLAALSRDIGPGPNDS